MEALVFILFEQGEDVLSFFLLLEGTQLYQTEYQASELSYVSPRYAILAAQALQDIDPLPETSLPMYNPNIVISNNGYPCFKPKILPIQSPLQPTSRKKLTFLKALHTNISSFALHHWRLPSFHLQTTCSTSITVTHRHHPSLLNLFELFPLDTFEIHSG